MIDTTQFWVVTVLLGAGTFAIRYSFLGLLRADRLSPRMQVHLRYVAVAVLPAMVVPMVVWPSATGGVTDVPRMAAALLAFLAARRFGPAAAIVAGMGGLWIFASLLH